jgi:SNF2 family DNA or RNA helicase
MQLIEDNPNDQIVVFGQSKQVINMLSHRLTKKNIPTGILTGDTPQGDRGRLVTAFQRGDLRVFAGTIGAGGVGITLTASSTVVFLDRAWSPAVNRQAEDRLHRIGQKNAVQVIDIVARNTVDLGRLQRIRRKWIWLRQILGDQVSEIQETFLKGFEDELALLSEKELVSEGEPKHG